MAAISTDTDRLPNRLPGTLHGGTAFVEGAPASASAVSWAAVIAGAAAAAALSLILLILGTGLGLSSVSPWAYSGVSAQTLGISTILWLTFTQIVSSALGGYLAGRLRTKWTDVERDEAYFRDTAHGFLAWAVASLATAALLTSAIGSIVESGVQAGASVASGVAGAAGTAVGAAGTAAGIAAARTGGDSGGASESGAPGGIGYFVDSLMRKSVAPSGAAAQPADAQADSAAPAGGDAGSAAGQPATVSGTPPQSANVTNEVTRIFANALRTGSLPQEDRDYLAQLVAQRAGIDPQQAQQRVTETFTKLQNAVRDAEASAKEAADTARKASAATALWMFISLLIGAFVASLSATYGGRQRDV